ncbi:hypothetical protein HK100_002378 [Physocladia obscura]|uniref:NAD(P)-binding protein n=1 Tax=Physocladia obscura TaxID=109957 RepID=A0AAD5SY34_9FUNG|nr:hypothetical protein HK100_002378 [Physocladia obscura]
MVHSALVTGANKGLGFECVKQLSAAFPDAIIFMGTRSASRGAESLAKLHATNLGQNVQVLELDVLDPLSIERARVNVQDRLGKSTGLDVLINNAGVSGFDGNVASVFEVNVFAVKNVTNAFLPIISVDGLVINVSSEAGTWAQHHMNAELQRVFEDIENATWDKVFELALDYQKPVRKYEWPAVEDTVGAYGISKALLNFYSRRLAAENLAVRFVSVCPGSCATDINGNTGYRTAAKGGSSILWPVLNSGFTTGLLYQDGKALEFAAPMSAEFAAHLKSLQGSS